MFWMPAKFVKRDFKVGSWYHVYNKGQDGEVFTDDQDHRVFLFYLFVYLVDPVRVKRLFPEVSSRLLKHNLVGKAELEGYCVMPDHYHLLLQQFTQGAISMLMKQVINGYTTYYNLKSKHQGNVFRGRFKAVAIERPDQQLEMLRFVHVNPVVAGLTTKVEAYDWSSVGSFFGTDKSGFELDKRLVKRNFGSPEEWLAWHNDGERYEREVSRLAPMLIDTII
jgi:putative transposase